MDQALEIDYRFVIGYGDGNPKEVIVKAKNGRIANELAIRSFPGARSVHFKGLLHSQKKVNNQVVKITCHKPQVFIGGLQSKLRPVEPLNIRKQKRITALELAKEGKTSGQISKLIDIPPSTVRRWIKNEAKNACHS